MTEPDPLIPPTPAIRAKLAANIRERRRLRSLLRIALRAAEDRAFLAGLRQNAHEPRPEAPGREGGQ